MFFSSFAEWVSRFKLNARDACVATGAAVVVLLLTGWTPAETQPGLTAQVVSTPTPFSGLSSAVDPFAQAKRDAPVLELPPQF